MILVFGALTPLQHSKENSLVGDLKYTGMGKVCDFRLKSPFISETVRDRPRPRPTVTVDHY